MNEKLHFRRFEFKYPIDKKRINVLLPQIFNYMEVDENAKDVSGYKVLSLYFDSPNLKTYHEKLDGLLNRKKFRFRVYEDNFTSSGLVFSEIKRKQGPVIIKDRSKIKLNSFDSLSNNDFFNLKDLDSEFAYDLIKFNMTPSLLVRYQRQPFFSKDDKDFRVTIDYNLEFKNLRAKNKKFVKYSDDIVILELKFNGSMPKWFKGLIQSFNLSADTFSKYCSGIDACYGLPNSF